MKTNKLGILAVFLASGLAVCAQNNNPQISDDRNTGNDDQIFRANEFSLDLFGTATINQQTVDHFSGDRAEHNGRLGAGAGLNYFFTRNLGFSADAYSENTDHFFIDSASGNFVFRFPLDAIHLAPYVFAGGGHQFDFEYRWFGQAGAGVDLRFTHNVGLFADARYELMDRGRDVALGRLGVRIAF